METKSKFTPGPWKFDDSKKYCNWAVIRHNGQIVATINRTLTISEDEANSNARLIEQAPKMAKAISELLNLLLDQSAINLEKDGYLKGNQELGVAIAVLTGLNHSKAANEARSILAAIEGE